MDKELERELTKIRVEINEINYLWSMEKERNQEIQYRITDLKSELSKSDARLANVLDMWRVVSDKLNALMNR